MTYWRPGVAGRRALVGFYHPPFCDRYRVVDHVRMPTDNEERGAPVASCTLRAPLATLWPRLVGLYGR